MLVVFFLDPFGLKSATNDESVEIYSRVMSDFYGHTGQERISVAIMTDKAAEEMAEGYPVPLRIHGEVVAAILCAGAKSVFVDINFRWERFTGDAEEFVDALSMRKVGNECRKLDRDEVKKHPVKVILGHTPSRTSSCDPVFPEFNDAAADCKETSAKSPFAGLSKVATIVSLPEPKTDLRYQLSEAMPSADKTVLLAPATSKLDLVNLEKRSVRLNSPAVASLYVICADDSKQSPLCDPSNSDLEATLVARWGWEISRKDRDLKRWLNGTCINRSPVNMFLEHRIRRAAESGDVCPYHDTMAANDIRTAVAFGNKAPDPNRPQYTGDFILQTMFKDRSAFYGLQITGIGDYVRSPTLGRVPGVYAHAMALDNLLTEGEGFWHEPRHIFKDSAYWTWSLAVELVLGLGLLLIGWRVEERNDADYNEVVRMRGNAGKGVGKAGAGIWSIYDALARLIACAPAAWGAADKVIPGRSEYRLHWARKWLFLFFGLVSVVGVTAIEIWWLYWPPSDWIVLFTLILAAKPGHRKYDEWTGKKPAWTESIRFKFQKFLLRFGR